MKFQKEKLIFLIYIFISFLFTYLSWDYINFKYTDPGIIGAYSMNNHHSFNDVFRYIVFIITPLITFIGVKAYYEKNFFIDVKNLFSNIKFSYKANSPLSWIVFFVIVVFLILEFFSISFPIHSLDSYHEGQKMSAAYKSLLDNSLWSGSYLTVGVFYEILSSKYTWQIFDHTSVGLIRFTEIFLILTIKLLLTLFLFCLSNFLKLTDFNKIIFVIINVLFFSFLINYDPGVDLISSREIPIIILLVLFILLLRNNNNLFYLFLISLLSTSSMIWAIDRGLVCNLLILCILIYLFLIGEYKKSFLFIIFIFLSWLILFYVLKNEFYYFIENTITIFKEINYIHGLIHPKPFTDDPNSTRATKTLLSIILAAIISINLIFSKKNEYDLNLKRIFIFLTIIAISGYLYALGRSDGPHIKNSFGYPLILISTYISYNFLLLISKRKEKYLTYFISFLFIIITIFSFKINYQNLFTFKDRFNSYIYLSDEFFLNSNELNLVKELRPQINDFECIQLLSNDAALYYLLRKKSCTKYYYVWNSTSQNIQKKFIKELKTTKIIIEGGKKNDWEIPLEKKLFLIYDELDKNFVITRKIGDWNVFLR